MFSFFKKLFNKPVPSLSLDIAETEQKTPKAGYILLIAMVVVSLFFGWRAVDDLQDVPQRPEILSYCANQFFTYEWEDFGRYENARFIQPEFVYEPNGFPVEKNRQQEECTFSHLEVSRGIPAVYEARKAMALSLQNVQLELDKTNNSIVDLERQYNLGLQERIAEEQRQLYPLAEIQRNLEPLRRDRASLEIQIDALRSDLKKADDELKGLYANLLPDYRREWRWYEFKVFLLEAIFVVPFFALVFALYWRLLRRKSPYTIIFTALVGVASILLVRIFIVWFWNLFLARILQTLWAFVQNFALLKSIVFYAGMGLSIFIFGGAVYLLQKHIFDPKRVALRSLKHNKCPQCEFTLDVAAEYCPNCGRHIRETCQACGKQRFVDFPVCPHCGAKK